MCEITEEDGVQARQLTFMASTMRGTALLAESEVP